MIFPWSIFYLHDVFIEFQIFIVLFLLALFLVYDFIRGASLPSSRGNCEYIHYRMI